VHVWDHIVSTKCSALWDINTVVSEPRSASGKCIAQRSARRMVSLAGIIHDADYRDMGERIENLCTDGGCSA